MHRILEYKAIKNQHSIIKPFIFHFRTLVVNKIGRQHCVFKDLLTMKDS